MIVHTKFDIPLETKMKVVFYGPCGEEELSYSGSVKELQTFEFVYNRKARLDLTMFLEQEKLDTMALQQVLEHNVPIERYLDI